MTATAAVSRPTLYLVPTGSHRAPVPDQRSEREPLPVLASTYAARVLGTLFAPIASRLARGLVERAPLLARQGRSDLWAAAIAYLLAEESQLFELDCCVTRTAFAREVGSTLPTLRRRVAALRVALDPMHLDLPPLDDGGYSAADTS